MTGRIVSLARSPHEGKEWRAGRHGHARVGTARTAPVIPRDEPIAGLSDEAVALASGAARTVIHRVTALPLIFAGAFEDRGRVRLSEKGREQAVSVTGAGRAVGNLGRIVRRPPNLVRARGRRTVGACAARNG